MDTFGSMPMGSASSTNETSRLTEQSKLLNFIYHLIVLSISPVIEPSSGPQRTTRRSRGSRRGESQPTSTRKGSGTRRETANQARLRSGRAQVKEQMRMSYWKENYPKWYGVLQHLRMVVYGEVWKNLWLNFTSADAEFWLTAGRQWYEERNNFSYSGVIGDND